jgi:hypothetical protein
VRGRTSPEGATVAGRSRFVDLSVSAFLFFFPFFVASFGFDCVVAPACLLYRVVAILI